MAKYPFNKSVGEIAMFKRHLSRAGDPFYDFDSTDSYWRAPNVHAVHAMALDYTQYKIHKPFGIAALAFSEMRDGHLPDGLTLLAPSPRPDVAMDLTGHHSNVPLAPVWRRTSTIASFQELEAERLYRERNNQVS